MKAEFKNREADYAKKTTDGEAVDINGIFSKLIFHWPLFFVTALFAIAMAFIYLRYSRPIYSSTAKIYIKDEKKSGTAGRQMSSIEDFALVGGSKLVENEMEVIKSPLILIDVIRDHQFNIRYFGQGRVAQYEIYEQLPIKVNILTDSADVGNYVFDVSHATSSGINVHYKDENDIEHVIHTNFNQPFLIKKDRFSITNYPANDTRKVSSYHIKIDSIRQMAYRKAEELTTSLINKQSSVFQITYEDPVPKRAADFLNAVTTRYNQYTLEDKNQTALSTISFIETRLQSLGGELGQIEQNVETFKKTRGITEISENSKLFLEQVKEADQRLNEASIQLSLYDQVEKYINSRNPDQFFAPAVGNMEPALSALLNDYQGLLNEAKKLSLSLLPNSPILENLQQRISDTRNTIKSYISNYRRNAVTTRTGLQTKVNELEGMIAKIPSYERQFINLRRQQNVKEDLYIYLLQKKEETAISYASNIITNRVISPAYIPLFPVSPKKNIIIFLFFAASVGLTSLYLYLKYFLNNKLTSKQELEGIVNGSVLAEIFMQEKGKKPVLQERSIMTEQLLNLRNNLKFILNEVVGTPVILFTSSISGEGKTFLSSHLASSLTSNNRKVVLMELDLRKPKLSQSLGISNHTGFTNFVLGTANIDDIIKPVSTDATNNLFIIPSGPIPPNPIEMLENERMMGLLDILKKRFDFVIIDTSPIGLVSDAKSLSKNVDCALFVVRFNYTPKAKLIQVVEEADMSFFRRIGYVFNGIDTNSSYSQYGYGYSNYGYAYGTYGQSATSGLNIKMLLKKLKGRFI